MLKKVILSTLAIMVALSLLMPVTALAASTSNQSETIVKPCWTYISNVNNSLGINSSGQASMLSSINAYSGTSVSMINYLQRYQNGSWTNVQGWSSSTQGTYGSWSNSYYVSSGYSYRLLTYFYVYNGSTLLESTSLTSPTKNY